MSEVDSIKDDINRFKDFTKDKKNILITTHIFPDADGIGGQIALSLALRELGHNALCCNEEKLLERYHYLDPSQVVNSLDDIQSQNFKPDLFIVVDTNMVERTGRKMAEFIGKTETIFIDHHPFKGNLSSHHFIDTTKAATGQLVGELIEGLGIKLTPEIALPLYTAILIDTSSFRYPTVSSDTHKLISKLLATGIRPAVAYNKIYGTKKISHMHLLGHVLSQAQINKENTIAWIFLSEKDLAHFDIELEDTHAFINHLLILDEVKVACMFRLEGKTLKLSMRSSGEFDVGEIAMNLGGGGHSHSAATLIQLDKIDDELIQNEIVKLVDSIELSLKNL